MHRGLSGSGSSGGGHLRRGRLAAATSVPNDSYDEEPALRPPPLDTFVEGPSHQHPQRAGASGGGTPAQGAASQPGSGGLELRGTPMGHSFAQMMPTPKSAPLALLHHAEHSSHSESAHGGSPPSPVRSPSSMMGGISDPAAARAIRRKCGAAMEEASLQRGRADRLESQLAAAQDAVSMFARHVSSLVDATTEAVAAFATASSPGPKKLNRATGAGAASNTQPFRSLTERMERARRVAAAAASDIVPTLRQASTSVPSAVDTADRCAPRLAAAAGGMPAVGSDGLPTEAACLRAYRDAVGRHAAAAAGRPSSGLSGVSGPDTRQVQRRSIDASGGNSPSMASPLARLRQPLDAPPSSNSGAPSPMHSPGIASTGSPVVAALMAPQAGAPQRVDAVVMVASASASLTRAITHVVFGLAEHASPLAGGAKGRLSDGSAALAPEASLPSETVLIEQWPEPSVADHAERAQQVSRFRRVLLPCIDAALRLAGVFLPSADTPGGGGGHRGGELRTFLRSMGGICPWSATVVESALDVLGMLPPDAAPHDPDSSSAAIAPGGASLFVLTPQERHSGRAFARALRSVVCGSAVSSATSVKGVSDPLVPAVSKLLRQTTTGDQPTNDAAQSQRRQRLVLNWRGLLRLARIADQVADVSETMVVTTEAVDASTPAGLQVRQDEERSMRSALEALRRAMTAAEAPHIHIDAQWLDLGGGPGALSATLAAAVRHHSHLLREQPANGQTSPRQQRRTRRLPRTVESPPIVAATTTPQSMMVPAALPCRDDGPDADDDQPQWSGDLHHNRQQRSPADLVPSPQQEQQRRGANLRAATPSALPRLAALGNNGGGGATRPFATTPEPGSFGVRGVGARPSEAAVAASTVSRHQPSSSSSSAPVRLATPSGRPHPSSREANKRLGAPSGGDAAAPLSPNVGAW